MRSLQVILNERRGEGAIEQSRGVSPRTGLGQPGSARIGSRRGSILILVVALLVLIALIGTAYVSVARIDRQAAATGGTNTQMDLMAAGVAQQAESMILNNLFAFSSTATPPGSYYRPANLGTVSIQSTDPTAAYHDYDSPFDDKDAWLASRLPEPLDVEQLPSATNPVVWQSVSLLQNSSMSNTTTGSGYEVDVPNSPTPVILGGPTTHVPAPLGSGTATGKISYRFAPTYELLTVNGVKTPYPAISIYTVNPNTVTVNGTAQTVLAADADGDGIADSLYFKLDHQPDPGITYYGAMRVIDNNSAINASTAWSLRYDFDGSATAPAYTAPNLGIFASNVGLEEMLRTYLNGTPPTSTEMQRLNAYRFNWPAYGGVASLPALDGATYPVQAYPYDDPNPNNWSNTTGLARTDYQYITYGDMLTMGLARRMDNPAYQDMSGTVKRFQPFTWSDSAALAHDFCIPQSSTPSSTIESILDESTMDAVGSTGANHYAIGPNDGAPSAYSPDLVISPGYASIAGGKTKNGSGQGYWYNDNFDFDSDGAFGTSPSYIPTYTTATYRPLRALLVAKNPVSDNVPWDSTVLPQLVSTVSGGVTTISPNKPMSRANLNTSDYNDLFLAFLSDLNRCDYVTYNPFRTIQFGGTVTATIGGITTTSGLAGTDVQRLRASLAAINTMAMRSGMSNNYSYLTAPPPHQLKLSGSDLAYTYPVTPQPFITEVVVNEIDPAQGDESYIAIKLFNPTTQTMELKSSNWQIVGEKGSALTTLATFDGSVSGDTEIGPNSYIWITSANSTPKPWTKKPTGVTWLVTPDSTKSMVIPSNSLDNGCGSMILLIRPVAGGSININDPTSYAPIDQVDLSGIGPVSGSAKVWFYARPQTAWGCVYPSSTPAAPVASNAFWTVMSYDISDLNQNNVGNYNNWMGSRTSGNSKVNGFMNQQLGDTPETFTSNIEIPLGSDMVVYPGPDPIAATKNKYPFGGFARDGDAFKIPFVGSYVVTTTSATPTLVGMNSVSYDSYNAEDGDSGDDATETVGQFCPVGDPTATTPTYDYSQTASAHRYYFARFLLDYVGATNTPDSDYAPNVDPNSADGSLYAMKTGKAPQAVPNNPNLHPLPQSAAEVTAKDNSKLANHTDSDVTPTTTPPTYDNEYDQPIEGLVNINTAPWPVLAMLPMVTDANGGIDQSKNTQLAKAIVAYRDKYGPFTSIFDLNKVVDPANAANTFMNGWGTLTLGSSGEANAHQREFSSVNTITFPRSSLPADSLPKPLDQNEAKDRLNMISRISNLVTTRSDSFTVYVDVEGWKNAGDPSKATRVSQVRQAYIVDRSHVSGLNKTLRIIPVPTN